MASPSMSAWTSLVTISSAGQRPALLGHVVGVTHQFGVGRDHVRREVRIIGVHDQVGPVEQLLAVRAGTPMRSAMASSGSPIAMSSTKLPESFSFAAATISRAATASFSSSVATALGVNSRETICVAGCAQARRG